MEARAGRYQAARGYFKRAVSADPQHAWSFQVDLRAFLKHESTECTHLHPIIGSWGVAGYCARCPSLDSRSGKLSVELPPRNACELNMG